jgi:hypothetical protein
MEEHYNYKDKPKNEDHNDDYDDNNYEDNCDVEVDDVLTS